MSELNQEKILECYDSLHQIVLNFIHDGFPEEAHVAITHIMSMVIVAEAALFKENVEQVMDNQEDEVGRVHRYTVLVWDTVGYKNGGRLLGSDVEIYATSKFKAVRAYLEKYKRRDGEVD